MVIRSAGSLVVREKDVPSTATVSDFNLPLSDLPLHGPAPQVPYCGSPHSGTPALTGPVVERLV